MKPHSVFDPQSRSCPDTSYGECVVPKTIHSKGEGAFKAKILKESMKLTWNFQRGGQLKQRKNLCGGVWIFSTTTQ